MSRAELNKPAPNFTLTDFNGREVSLADFQGQEECPAGFQPRIFLTFLPTAHGAVAPGL